MCFLRVHNYNKVPEVLGQKQTFYIPVIQEDRRLIYVSV